MRVADQLVHLARLHGVDAGAAAANAAAWLERLGLAGRERDRIEALSLGNQQRAQLAAALVHDPELLVLDEPFSGLDPVGVDVLSEVLRERVRSGVPVVFSSHQLELVERICDDLVILSGGRTKAVGSAEELRDRGPTRYRVVLDDADAGWLRTTPGVVDVESQDGSVLLQVDDVDPAELLRQITARGRVREFARHRPALSEIFREAIR